MRKRKPSTQIQGDRRLFWTGPPRESRNRPRETRQGHAAWVQKWKCTTGAVPKPRVPRYPRTRHRKPMRHGDNVRGLPIRSTPVRIVLHVGQMGISVSQMYVLNWLIDGERESVREAGHWSWVAGRFRWIGGKRAYRSRRTNESEAERCSWRKRAGIFGSSDTGRPSGMRSSQSDERASREYRG